MVDEDVFTFYSKESCIYCNMLENDLKDFNLKYKKVDITNSEVDISSIREKSGMNTFPIIYLNDTLIGGYTEFKHRLITNNLGKNLIDF